MIVTMGTPYPLGVSRDKDKRGMNLACVFTQYDCGVVLFQKNAAKEWQEWKRIPFTEQYAVGNIYCMYLAGIPFAKTAYCFYEKDRLLTDVRGCAFVGGHSFGEEAGDVRLALFPTVEYDWEDDKKPGISYEESICYCLHVRGFTKHISSGVKGKGTFKGLMEKILYLKELGVTTLELQPVYDFAELPKKKAKESPFVDETKPVEKKINYWGYAEGNYYSPKNSYAYGRDAATECKDMVKALHANGIEVILQFYFTKEIAAWEIPMILRYWVMEYHVDGFHLKGENINPDMLAEEPALAKTKLWYYGFSEKKAEQDSELSGMRLLAEYQDDYRYDMRRFLKGDEGMLSAVMYHLRHNPAFCGKINYLTNYDGFTLMDLVSYDRKHNEDNGENNKDGNDYNASWNCGQEGNTRKKTVLALRRKQIKNALMLLMFSQGTPLLFMGDEFGNSQEGNNNPYCQDNKITWLNWKNLISGNDIFEFVKMLIAVRKAHPVFRQERELRFMDYGACGYPDASYHGAAPWKPDTASYSRQLGVMYCGKYAYRDRKTPDDFFYVAYNMHWEPHTFAMPKLPKGLEWELCIASDEDLQAESVEKLQFEILMPERCICIFKSRREAGKQKTGKDSKVTHEGMEAL